MSPGDIYRIFERVVSKLTSTAHLIPSEVSTIFNESPTRIASLCNLIHWPYSKMQLSYDVLTNTTSFVTKAPSKMIL